MIVDIPPDATVLTGKEAEKMYLHNIHTLCGKLLSRHHSSRGRKREGGEDGRTAKKKCPSCVCLFKQCIGVVLPREWIPSRFQRTIHPPIPLLWSEKEIGGRIGMGFFVSALSNTSLYLSSYPAPECVTWICVLTE